MREMPGVIAEYKRSHNDQDYTEISLVISRFVDLPKVTRQPI